MTEIDQKWKLDPLTGCHNWTGYTDHGYGRVRINDTLYYVHRLAYESHVGPLVQGLVVDHTCNNRKCMNPEHLKQVTQRENILRGTGASARNARKGACPRCGGEYTPQADGSRKCMACRETNRKGVIRKGIGRSADRVECPRGHPYNDENTLAIRNADGSVKNRQCRECGRQRVRARRAREKGGDA